VKILKGSLFQPLIFLAFTCFAIFMSIRNHHFLHFDSIGLIIQNLVIYLLIGLCFFFFFYQYKHLIFDNNKLIITVPLNPFIKTKIIDLNKINNCRIYIHRAGSTITLFPVENNHEEKKHITMDISNKSLDIFTTIMKDHNIRTTF
jgi:hypothetical protein